MIVVGGAIGSCLSWLKPHERLSPALNWSASLFSASVAAVMTRRDGQALALIATTVS